MLCPPMVETLTSGVPGSTEVAGAPPLNSVRLADVVPLRLTTQILPEASAATFCGSFRTVVFVYRMPSVQSLGAVPGQPPVLEKAGVAVTNPQIAAKLVGYAVAFVLVGFKLM